MTDSIACTIVARNYLPAARVLADSYLRHHPDSRFVILLVDADPGELEELAKTYAGNQKIKLAGPDDLPLPRAEFRRMATAYTVTELCTAVKPALLRQLLTEHEVAVYLDPDIEVFAPFPEVGELAAQHGIVLTPHVLEPMPRDGLRPSEADIMASGVFNLGFLAVSAKGGDFLDFWAERLRQDAISAPAEQLFTDQRWVDNVPPLFGHTVLTDPGYNVAYWNVYQRPLESSAPGQYTVDGKALRFYHFSGYRPEKPWLLSTHFADRPRVLLSEHPVLGELCAAYRQHLLDAGYGEALESIPYRWNKLPDGTPLTPALRRVFRQAWVDAERDGDALPPDPFADEPDSAGADAFLRWATAPADPMQAAAGSNRWAMAVWHNRGDLQDVYRDPLGVDADGFRQWCATSGISEGALHPSAVPTGPARQRHVPVQDRLGVNVLGYLTAELGVGEMGRRVHEALRASGLSLATTVEEASVVNRTDHPFATTDAAAASRPEFPVSVLCVNADMTAGTLRMYPELAEDRYVIGVWSWELDEFPESMRAAFAQVDEIWTISEFCRKAIAAHAPVPVHTFPVPVPVPAESVAPESPARESTVPQPESADSGPLPKADGTTRFLFAFDFHSLLGRKNPLGAIEAFRRAFPAGDEPAELVLKSINGDKHPALRERLRAAAAEDDRVLLVEDYLTHAEVAALFGSADCYLSLHRSEGFGLTVAEAMAAGLPVIATNYSGNAEFYTAEAGWPVPATLVPVGPDQFPYPPDAQWAEPDLDVAAKAMRTVLANPELAVAKGRAGRELLRRNRSPEAAADWARQRISEAVDTWRLRRDLGTSGSPRPHKPTTTLQPLREAKEALRWRPDTTAPSRNPLAPALRRGVLRLVDHYDVHQRKVLGALADGTESSLARLDDKIDALSDRLSNPPDLSAVHERVDTLENQFSYLRDVVGTELDNESSQRFEQDKALATRLDELGGQLSDVARGSGDLDAKLVGMLAERDAKLEAQQHKLTELERANGELRNGLDAVRAGLQRHHELLNPSGADADSTAVPTDVGLLRLPSDDTVVLPWLRTYGSWEQSESALVDELLAAGGTFVDIGAHVGYYTVRGLRKVGKDGAVFAVEPWQRVRELLRGNVSANVPADTVGALTVLSGAAWDADGPLKLALDPDGNSGDNRIGPDGSIEVDGIRLDGVEALRARTVSLVKVDAQGRDHKALAGMADLIRRDRPHVICEFWPQGIEDLGDDPEAVLADYREWGYRLLPVTDNGPAARSPKDSTLIRSARQADGEFLTLWLKPR